MPEKIVLCIGTKKGLFVAESARTRKRFNLRGPFGNGVDVYSALIDNRGTPSIYASSCNAFFGMEVLRSTDLGNKFKETKSAPAFPKRDGRAVQNIWSLAPGKTKKDFGAASNRLRFFAAVTVETHGNWCRESASIGAANIGSLAMVDCACTRSSEMATVCTWECIFDSLPPINSVKVAVV